MSFTTTTSHPEPSREIERVQALFESIEVGDRASTDISALSDLSWGSSRAVGRSWRRLPVEARRHLARAMVETSRRDLGLNFGRVLRMALSDADAEVRILAIHGLCEDESTALLEQLLDRLPDEPESGVLEAIASALGRFSHRAEMDELDPAMATRVRQALLGLFHSDADLSVRCRSLESVAFFAADAEVDEAIAAAYGSRYADMQRSALVAMGRNLGGRWYATVLSELRSEEPELRAEAARASGEYADERAVDSLVLLLDDEDDEVRVSALGALGQIGGREAVAALKRATRSEDPRMKEAAERALGQARYDQDPLDFLHEV